MERQAFTFFDMLWHADWIQAFGIIWQDIYAGGIVGMAIFPLAFTGLVLLVISLVSKSGVFVRTYIILGIIAVLVGILSAYLSYIEIKSMLDAMMGRPKEHDLIVGSTYAVAPILLGVETLLANLFFMAIGFVLGKQDKRLDQ